GMGKTHLAQAIGIEVKKRFPDKYVLYVSAQKFQAQYTSAMQRKEINDFIHFYQMIDVLIVDDIQEFSGNKPGTQNTFFNIFNHLHLSKKQLVLTSDKPPVELKDIEERLLTRFKWGLSVELTTPDYETKVKIIRNKCRRLGVDIDEEIIAFLAENIKANIREIEGAISSFIANATLLGRPATISLARDILKAYVSFSRKEITPEAICEIVYTFFNVTKEDFFSKKRSREIVQARQVSMYLCKKHTNLSLKSIGEAIERDHATVVHAIKTVTNLIETDKGLRAHIEQIEKQIR
ncbi:MAG: chromosomal replication initiator protein DnaA, partial [Rikenellaceae bacterium]|nr:chromosomal replication initiator protein DnaA [Rikenellaceae bacterium]